jgi:uncharacterized 2Fe-2S/4Fe-4S cluster protein (DUF4445 family)
MPSVRVRFLPDDCEVALGEGKTLLEAAQAAGVYVGAVCGGRGTCGKCRLRVRRGEVSAARTDHLTREELGNGYVLACRTSPRGDVVVEVPPEVRLTGYVGLAEDAERLTDFDPAAPPCEAAQRDPLVRKTFVNLPEPSLEDPRPDARRLLDALAEDHAGPIRMELDVLRRLPRSLRRLRRKGAAWSWAWDGRVTVALGRRGESDEVLGVEPGDSSARGFGLAVDVGTTTVVAHLVDLHSGETRAAAAKYNSQINFGGDVISRIQHTRQPGGAKALQRAVVADIDALVAELAARTGIDREDVLGVVAAGNTTMLHLLLGLETDPIRLAPFVPAAGCVEPLRAAEIGLRLHPRAMLYAMPMVGSFVGGDMTAGVLACGLHRADELSLLIDIGTNGEMVLGNREFAVACAASAGPAFEGGSVTCGMRAAAGAIDSVRIGRDALTVSVSTIGRRPALGLCGSGLIEALAEMLRAGLVDRSGRFQPDRLPERFRIDEETGSPQFVLVPAAESGSGRDVVLTQCDVENLIRTKAAVYAAADSLVQSVGLGFDDVQRVLIAGAFGSHLDVERSIAIGLLPDVPRERIAFLGNSSLAGAKQALLSRRGFAEAEEIRAGITYQELMVDPAYMEKFTSACFLPHTDLARFPSVMRCDGEPAEEALLETGTGGSA